MRLYVGCSAMRYHSNRQMVLCFGTASLPTLPSTNKVKSIYALPPPLLNYRMRCWSPMQATLSSRLTKHLLKSQVTAPRKSLAKIQNHSVQDSMTQFFMPQCGRVSIARTYGRVKYGIDVKTVSCILN